MVRASPYPMIPLSLQELPRTRFHTRNGGQFNSAHRIGIILNCWHLKIFWSFAVVSEAKPRCLDV